MKRKKGLLKLCWSAGLIGSLTLAGTAAFAEAATTEVQFLGINDFHGALSTTGSAYLKDNAKYSKTGGAALLASYLDRSEANFLNTAGTNAKTFRVQAGDMVGASPANSGLLQDYPTILALNKMDFEIGTLGNHEFDEGLAEFNRIMTGGVPADSFYPIVKQFYEQYNGEKSNTEIVVGNVVNKSDGTIPYGWQPYTTREVTVGESTVKVGFIGVVTTEIPNLVLKEHYEAYEFLDEAETIAKYSKQLVEQGVNAIVVLAHVPSTSEGTAAQGEAADMMTKVNQLNADNSVDLVFAGHNHQYTNGYVGDTLVVQSTSQGKAYADVTGTLSAETGDFVEPLAGEILPVATAETTEVGSDYLVTADQEITKLIEAADTTVAEVTTKKIGTAEKGEDISRAVNEVGESSLGNLITDGQVSLANQKGLSVDFAMTNNGGIRDDLKVAADGTITWGAAQAVQPFGNIMQIVEMTGAQIKTVLNQQTFTWDAAEKKASGYYLQVSGLKYTVTELPGSAGQQSVVSVKKSDGTPLVDSQTYRVVINDFLYGGGDGFSEFTKAKLIGAMQPDTETFVGYIESLEAANQKVSAPAQDRKVYRTAEELVEDEAIDKIIAATSFDPFKQGDKYLTGKTLPNAKVTVSKESGTATQRMSTEVITTLADAEGKFSADVSSLEATPTDLLWIEISDDSNYTATFKQPIAVIEPNPDSSTDQSTTTSSTGTSGTASSTGTSDSSNKTLPQTGAEEQTGIAALGVVFIFAGTYIYRKKIQH